jgi:hypothetical protein
MPISVGIVLALAIAGVVIRIAIFNTPHSDRGLSEMLDGHLPVQGDLLFWKLWRSRSLVDSRHRWKIVAYFWLTIATVVGLLAVVVFSSGIWP